MLAGRPAECTTSERASASTAETTVTITDFGTALTGFAVQECHPYCYRANLTVGVDLLAASETSLRGEILFAFPPSVAPIANAVGRNSLGWIYLDGPALPEGTTLTAELVLKSTDKGILVANSNLNVTPQQWHFADRAFWLVIKARHDAASLTPAVRAAIWSVDREQPIVRVVTLDTVVASTALARRFALLLFEGFGLTALFLTAVGIYGVVSSSVTNLRDLTRNHHLRL